MYGSNDWEGAQIDMVVDCLEDTIKPMVTMHHNKDESEKVLYFILCLFGLKQAE